MFWIIIPGFVGRNTTGNLPKAAKMMQLVNCLTLYPLHFYKASIKPYDGFFTIYHFPICFCMLLVFHPLLKSINLTLNAQYAVSATRCLSVKTNLKKKQVSGECLWTR